MFALSFRPEAVGLPGGLMVHGQELLLGQQGGQFLQHCLQLQLVPEPPDTDELHVHMQSSTKLAVYKVRIADAFLSTDRGRNLYRIDQALGTLNTAELPVGAYTGARLAAWISSNYASAVYVEAQNSIEVASDGNRRILSDAAGGRLGSQ